METPAKILWSQSRLIAMARSSPGRVIVEPTGISARFSRTPLFKLLPSKTAPATTYSLGSLKSHGLISNVDSVLSFCAHTMPPKDIHPKRSNQRKRNLDIMKHHLKFQTYGFYPENLAEHSIRYAH